MKIATIAPFGQRRGFIRGRRPGPFGLEQKKPPSPPPEPEAPPPEPPPEPEGTP